MSHRPSVALAGVLLILAGCGAAATPIPSTGAASTAPSTAASTATASTEGSVEASTPASAGSSSATGSFAIPSFKLPSEAKDLEAILPGTICGTAATKLSQTGDKFATSADPTFLKVLQALGKSPTDVAYAIAIGGSTGCAAGVFRISGVDSNALKAAFQAQAQQAGDTFAEKTVGGKQVAVQTNASAASYFYFAGDAVLFVVADSDAKAATILQQMP